MLALTASVLFFAAQPEADLKGFQGSWKVTALVEDGKSLTEKEIATSYSADGKLAIDGNVLSLLPPGSFDRKTVIFSLGTESGQTTIDLAGTGKAGSKGIYALSGESLLVCVGKKRPAEFSAGAGSDNILLALKRVGPSPPKAAPVAPVAPAAPAAKADPADMRAKLVGTWGHQDDKAVHYFTLNADGTFSAVHNYKKGFKKLFDDEDRSSGTWKLEGTTVVVVCRESTMKHREGHVFSYKVTTLEKDYLITVDMSGDARREWRVR